MHPGWGRVPRHIDANSGDGDVNNGTGGHDEISTLMVTMGMILILWQLSGQIIIFHQARFPWNKGISLTKPPFGVKTRVFGRYNLTRTMGIMELETMQIKRTIGYLDSNKCSMSQYQPYAATKIHKHSDWSNKKQKNLFHFSPSTQIVINTLVNL